MPHQEKHAIAFNIRRSRIGREFSLQFKTAEVKQSKWIRASRSGIFRLEVSLGEEVENKQLLGIISDAFGETRTKVRATAKGIVICHTQNPLVNQGDAIIHLAIMTMDN